MTLACAPYECAYELMKALRVLVIENDALIAMLLTEMLAGMGHDVCATAATEADAVSAATRYDPDLMIVDAGLGRGSGVSAVEEILRAGPLAHVFISGDAGRLGVRKPDAVVVRKPFREAELARAIDLALAAAPRASMSDYAARGTVTETVVPGEAADVVTAGSMPRRCSCRGR